MAAPIVDEASFEKMGDFLADRAHPITEKMRMVFTLSNLGGPNAVKALARGLSSFPASHCQFILCHNRLYLFLFYLFLIFIFYSLFFILYSLFFILYSSFFITIIIIINCLFSYPFHVHFHIVRCVYVTRNKFKYTCVVNIYALTGFEETSALLLHEVAYVLGQMREPSAVPILTAVLRDTNQLPIVRHEVDKR